MQSSPSIQGYKLPDVVNPPDTVCMQIEIPNDPAYLQAVVGALFDTTLWISWQRDAAHTGTRAATRMRSAWIKACATIGNCPELIIPAIEESEYQMSVCEQLRFQNGKLQGFCCGEWVDIDGQIPSGQGGGGSPTPPPGGGCQDYHAIIPAGGTWLLPGVVNAGDTLTFSDLTGATTNDAPLGRWNCPDGKLFAAATCSPIYAFDTGAQIPGDPIGEIVFIIGSTWYKLDPTTTFTVPSGVSNQQVAFSLNYGSASSFAGQVEFNLHDCNNQTGGWSVSQDLTVQSGAWTPTLLGFDGNESIWTVGEGWREVACAENSAHGAAYDIVYVELQFSHATTLQHADVLYDATVGELDDGGGNKLYAYVSGVANLLATAPSVTGTGQTLAWDGTLANVDRLLLLLYGASHIVPTCPDPAGTATFREFHMNGIATNPF